MWKARRWLTALLLVFAVTWVALAHDERWELKVCAEPGAMPFSHRDGTGFEIEIAHILAEEIGARLTFLWHPLSTSLVRNYLLAGECDVILGVPDGYRELLPTVVYYRSPYVFTYRADREFEIKSLDDPILGSLRIGVSWTANPPHDALVARGLADRVVLEFGEWGYDETSHPLSRIVDAVVEGLIDVGIAWGPVAGYFAGRQPIPLRVVPVEPLIDPPFTVMVVDMTMAVRPGDEALRDRLNAALAARWDEIQDVLAKYNVPLLPTPRPVVSLESE